MTHAFDVALALQSDAEGRWLGRTSADYWNMVGPYGGITAALCQQAILADPRHAGEPLSLTVNYCAPVREGAFAIELEFPRTGRSTQHVALRMRQVDPEDPERPDRQVTVAQGLAVLGQRRPLWGITTAMRPQAPPPDHLLRRRPRPGIRWLERYDSRHVQPLHEPPAPGLPSLHWVRDDPPRPLDYPSLAALADSFLPPMYALRGQVVPIATVSMNVYFHAGAEALAAVGGDWLLGAVRSQIYEGGFFDSEAQLWHGERLLATSQQIVWYRD